MLHSFTSCGWCLFCGCTTEQAADQNLPQCIVADRYYPPAAADELEAMAGPLLAESRRLIRKAFEEIGHGRAEQPGGDRGAGLPGPPD